MSEVAKRIVAEIQANLNDRSGFDLTALDDDIQEEITEAWMGIVDREIAQ